MNNLITKLYHHATKSDNINFQNYALQKLKHYIPFDKAIWMDGAITDKGPHIYRCYPFGINHRMANELVNIRSRSALSVHLLRNPDSALNVDFSVDRFRKSENIYNVMRKYALEQAIIILTVKEATHSLQILAISRNLCNTRFDEYERKRIENLAPYLTDSYELYRCSQRNRQLCDEFEGKYSIAHGDLNGILIYAKSDFVQLLQLEWPQWSGLKLPAQIRANSERTYPFEYYGSKIRIKIHKVSDCLVLFASELGLLAMLSAREFQIADKYASGLSYKDVADNLYISPFTAKTHLTNIYRKLEVNSRVKLREKLGPSVYG